MKFTYVYFPFSQDFSFKHILVMMKRIGHGLKRDKSLVFFVVSVECCNGLLYSINH